MGFIQPNLPVVDIAAWSKLPRAERIIPMTRHIAENGFGTPDHACDVRREDRALHPWRLVLRLVHRRHRRLHRRHRLVDRADRVPEGRAVHHAVRSRRPRLLFRAAGRALLPADGIDPILAAARHHSTTALAQPGAADQGHRPDPVRRAALRRAAGVARQWRWCPTDLAQFPLWAR